VIENPHARTLEGGSPLHCIRTTHIALRRAVQDLEAEVTASIEPQPERIVEEVAFLQTLYGYHSGGEEQALFPVLERLSPDTGEAFLYDHVEENALLRELHDAVESFRERGGPLSAAFKRSVIALVEHLFLHSLKEDRIILPLLSAKASVAEQERISAGIIQAIPTQDLPVVLPWIVARLELEDQVSFLENVRAELAPERRGQLRAWMQAELPADALAPLVLRIPTL
jgi:hemerythrin-like domain-containing protein